MQGPFPSLVDWRRCNAWLYRLATMVAHRRARRRATRQFRGAEATAKGPRAVLYACGGRLGDTLLGAAFSARLRDWFGGPIVAVGRPETAVVLAPQVDRFVPLTQPLLHGDPAAARALVETVGPVRLVLTDPHLAYGGEAIAALVDAVPADARFAYAGHRSPDTAAGWRALPSRATVIPSLAKADGDTDPERVHVWCDLQHYFGAVLRATGRAREAADLPQRPLLPPGALDAQALVAFGLEPFGYVACQPSSSQIKKDWPAERWAALFQAHADQRFVLLGKQTDATVVPAPPGALDLRGRTSLAAALQIAASARAFVGADSGLSHAAAIAGRPTTVVVGAATLGRFFPYPQRLERPAITAVWHEGCSDCAGCQSLCRFAPLWRTHRSGLPCLAELAAEPVAAALRAALAVEPEPALQR